jgi:predicted nuclease of predicted toxin-antitoxin system
MKILVDENIPAMTAYALQESGHDVKDIRGTVLEGAKDVTLWKLAQEESRLLVTTDKGFSQRRHENHQGVLIVRLRRANRRKIHGRVLQAIHQYTPDEWPGLTVIITSDS